MYSDLPPESQEYLPDPAATPTQRLKKPGQERGRTRSFSKSNGSKDEQPRSLSHHRHHHHRRHGTPPPQVVEPQYDLVPIPGGYSLVRGDGTTVTPTSYDSHGINNPNLPSLRDTLSNSLQQYSVPSPVSPLTHSDVSILHPSSPHYAFISDRRLPNLPSIDTHTSPVSPVHNHYPNYEDILARSPAREQPGQQRPYQLILPHGSTANSRSSTPPIPPPKDGPVVSRGLTTVPLSSDEFSKLNENIDIDRFPLPPSPPQHSPEWHRNRNLSVATDDGLQRSGTGRSLVSAVSQISDSPSQPQTDNLVQNILHVDGENNMKRNGGNLYDASPELPREHTKMMGTYSRMQGEIEMKSRGSLDAGDEDGGYINEKAQNECVERETDCAREERLHMSATSYPGMEWNPYASGCIGDD
ncbi:hypothetical protein EYC84_002489 [Monilinia fructicola]|uniref:Uncharacterized protein n=1 Tax=Monilinia fructicola TaxID=38448 RepID=A0A5M9JP24_MONFR|nr:hypothetical protein EYC84_002489 [Monilinia fructicola]